MSSPSAKSRSEVTNGLLRRRRAGYDAAFDVKQLTVMRAAATRLTFQFARAATVADRSGGADILVSGRCQDCRHGERKPRKASIGILYLRTIVRAGRSAARCGSIHR